MKTLKVFCLALLACGSAFARPLVIESRKLLPLSSAVTASYGDYLIAMEQKAVPGDASYLVTIANLYRRGADGLWSFERELASERDRATNSQQAVAMGASVAAIRMPSGLHVFELTATGWEDKLLDVGPRRPRGTFVDVRGSTILATNEVVCSPEALIINRRDNGHWEITAHLALPDEGCVYGLALDVREAILLSRFDDPTAFNQAQIFERADGAWFEAARFASPEHTLGRNPGRFGPATAMRGDLALVAGSDLGSHIYRRDASGWREAGVLADPDSYGFGYRNAGDIRITDDYVLQVTMNVDRGGQVGHVYRNGPDGSFEHLANLVTNNSYNIARASIYRDRVITTGNDRNIEFLLPASFAVKPLVQQDFESGAAPEWAPLPGSRFAIQKVDRTFMFRQFNVRGTSGAIHSATNIHQSVSADIVPRLFVGADAWVGLVTRYVDEDNYFFAMLRKDPDRVVLGRRVRGIETLFGAHELEVGVGQHYRVTLESVGSHHSVYIDGRRVTDVFDGGIFRGRAGIRMFQAAADFDNLVVSPGPVANLVYHDINAQGGVWSDDNSQSFQTFGVGESLLLTGESRTDEVVQSLVTVGAFGAGEAPALGLVVRYVDANNYLFAIARDTHKLYLRKVVNGVVTQIGGVNLSTAPGTSFVLRLEAVGDRARVYVDDVLRVETAGVARQSGRVGAFTHDAAALFAAYTAFEP